MKEFSNVEITVINNQINLYGPKDEILNAKLKITSLIAEKIKSHFSKTEENIRLSKNIEWKFEFQTDKWKSFSLYINSQIESAFNKKEKFVKFLNEENKHCTINFDSSPIKLTLDNKTSFKVKRKDLNVKPSFFERLFGARREASSEVNTIYPSNWTGMSETVEFSLVDLDESCNEYKEVVNDFLKKINKRIYQIKVSLIDWQVTIFYDENIFLLKVQRVQNKIVYEAYLTFKKRFKVANKKENEMILYHGTKSSSVDSISRFGFNRSYCGVNGVVYGQGVYFSTSSSYSHSYTDQYKSLMFRTRVIVGDTILGNSSMRVPPLKLNSEPYDSTCDSNKSIFVCYHDNQCYPEYLISYR